MRIVLFCLAISFGYSAHAGSKSLTEILMIVSSESGCIDARYFIPKGKFNEKQRNWLRAITTYIAPSVTLGTEELLFKLPGGTAFARTSGDQLVQIVSASDFEKWATRSLMDNLKLLLKRRAELIALPADQASDVTKKMGPVEAAFQEQINKVDAQMEKEFGIQYESKDGGPGCMH
jgi:hypothetical protein